MFVSDSIASQRRIELDKYIKVLFFHNFFFSKKQTKNFLNYLTTINNRDYFNCQKKFQKHQQS